MRTETFGDATLILGDSWVVNLSGKADLVVTDPPYLLTSGGAETGKMGGCFAPENYNNSGDIAGDIGWGEIMAIISLAMKENSEAYVMCNNRNVREMLSRGEDSYLGFHNLLVWDKITATPNRWYMKNCEFVGYFYKGKAREINDCSAKQLIRCPQVDETSHPTEKPVALMAHYIRNSSDIGSIVVDPFMGTGTTGVAALTTGRKFIGVELQEKYFDVACRRIEKAVKNLQLDL